MEAVPETGVEDVPEPVVGAVPETGVEDVTGPGV